MRALGLLTAFVAILMSGCLAGAPSTSSCHSNADCSPGSACVDSRCLVLCSLQSDCDADLVCSSEGICVEPQDGPAPEIHNVLGNAGDETTSHIRNGLVIEGAALDTSAFEVHSATTHAALTVARASDTRAEILLPLDILSGKYLLTATNQSGSDEQSIELLLPEIDGNSILAKLNAPETQGQLDVGLIPVGSNANQVASGDHLHDARYYTRDEVDAAIAAASGTSISGSCPPGHAVTGISASGELQCGPTIISSFSTEMLVSQVDTEAVAIMQTTIDIPGPGTVYVDAEVDVFFNNDSAAHQVANVLLDACTVPDTWGGNNPSACSLKNTYNHLYYQDGTNVGPSNNFSLLTALPLTSAGTKTIYLNLGTGSDDIIKPFRGKLRVVFAPQLD